MKDTTFFIVVGMLAAVSLTSGILGWRFSKRQEEKEKHGKASTFRDVYEDNAPVSCSSRTPRDLAEEYAEDCGCIDFSDF